MSGKRTAVERETDTERDRQRERQRHRERDRDTERVTGQQNRLTQAHGCKISGCNNVHKEHSFSLKKQITMGQQIITYNLPSL